MKGRSIVGFAAMAAAVAVFWAVAAPSFAQDPAAAVPGTKAGGGGKGFGKGKAKAPSKPTPHHPDGRVNFGPEPGEQGVWAGNAGRPL